MKYCSLVSFMITLAILLGSDYNQGIRGLGRESACQIVRSIGDSPILKKIASEGLSFAKKPNNSKKKAKSFAGDNKENYADNKRDYRGSESGLPTDNQFLQVINAYMRPKCHSADSDAVHRVFALCPVNRSQLHQICTQYFEWPPTKTDEYILPKIAERYLRRFANLRSTTSALGVHVPINEMPVKCPVSSIVKQRKVQGRQYFEVSWEDIEGLEASAVPADLVESACPEKILEFQQAVAGKQKPTRKSRQKKEAEMREIERKVQELMNVESSSSSNVVSPRELVAVRSLGSGHVDVDVDVDVVDAELESGSREGKVNDGGNPGCTTASRAPEIVDLISPPPRVQSRQVSRFKETRCMGMDVIELSDTDNDGSPEHATKMRELRLFIANIRDEPY